MSGFSEDLEKVLSHFVEKKYNSLTAEAVSWMRSLSPPMSGDDSGLADPFEEYGFQLCDQPSPFMDLYEREALNICSALTEKLTPLEVQVLGAFSDRFLDLWSEHDTVEELLDTFDASQLVTNELYGRLEQAAMNWFEERDLESDEDGT